MSPRVLTSQQSNSPLDVVFEQEKEEVVPPKPTDDVTSLKSDGTDVILAVDPDVASCHSGEQEVTSPEEAKESVPLEGDKPAVSPTSSVTASPVAQVSWVLLCILLPVRANLFHIKVVPPASLRERLFLLHLEQRIRHY